jgi:hypothetical protein
MLIAANKITICAIDELCADLDRHPIMKKNKKPAG